MALLTILAAAVAGAAILATADTEDTEDSVQVEKLGDSLNDNAFAVVNFGKTGIAGIQMPKQPERKTGYVPKTQLARIPFRTVSIPQNFAGLEAVDIPTRLADQFFEIVDVDEEQETVTITARHVWYQNLRNNTLWKPEEGHTYSCAEVCRNVLRNAVFASGFECATDCTTTLPAKELDFERKNLVEAFLDPEKGICKKFGLSLIRDNWRFYALKNVGYDRGFVVERGKNLLGIERQENIENLSTRVAPVAKDAEGNLIWMNHNGMKYIDSQYINDYSSPRLEIFDTGLRIGKDDVTDENIQAKLLSAAQKRFSEDKVDIPEVTMTIEFISLGDTEEYKQYRDLDKVYLYDILTVKDEVKGYNYAAQVIGVEHDILTGRLNSVTIGMLRQADASRKIAVWQVPEVDGANIRLLSIQAGSFEPGAIQHDDIAPRIITADLIKSGEIQTEHLQAGSITTEKLEAEAVTAGKIAAGAIETEKLAAYAVTSAKIAAGAVTTDKLDAGVITADKISATDLAAINAKLGTADIANAQIATADINFAHIKDLNAQSAYFGQTIFDEGIGGKLYVPRLNVGYAQMVGATIGDLVIQASNGNFYGIDVDMNGNVTATQRTVSAGEIAAGHTSDGRTLVLGTDILATDLSTENIYASHALMNEITAAVINVDELWARQAFIGKLMTTDITSNTYIQSRIINKIGDWQSGSTITQSINSLQSKITELGYGTVYFMPNEPSHENLTEGDIWVKSSNVADWNDLYSRQEEGQYVFADWQAVYNSFDDWQTLCAVDRMYIWTGVEWKEMYDADLPNTLQTEINQLASEITLKASRTEVDFLADEVTEFSAQLTIQAQEIQSAVSAVNLKAASYVMQADPRTAYTVSVGDIWVKWDGVTDWNDIYTRYDDWQGIYNTFGDWSELTGSKSYVWNGVVWVETSDRASEIYQRTLIDQTINQVTILAEASAEIGNDLIYTKAQLTVTNSAIQQEVQRATTAEGGKLDKTSQYQTADAIVTEAVSRSASNAIAKTSTYQTADSIVTEAVRQSGVNAANGYIAKTTTYQSASAIVNTAVSQAGTNASNTYIKKSGSYTSVDAILAEAQSMATLAGNNAKGASIAKTTSYQTADAIVNAAMTYTNGKLGDYSTTAQTSTLIAQYVGNNAYGKVSGITITSAGVDVSGSQYVKIASGGYFRVTSGNFGIKSDAGTNEYVIWSGASTAAASQFRVKKNGEVTLTKLMILNESGQETEVNLRTYGLWKLNYHTVKAYSTDSITLSNGAVVNFIKASSLGVGSGAGRVFVLNAGTEVENTSRAVVVGVDTEVAKTYSGGYVHFNAKAYFSAAGGATIVSSQCLIEDKAGSGLAFDAGIADYYDSSYWEKATADNNWTPKIPNSTNTAAEDWTDSGASDAFEAGKNGVTVTRVTLGTLITGTQYNCSVMLSSGLTRGGTINCATAYSDARAGYTAGTFTKYSGAQLYTIGQSGPEKYTGTLYVKS